MTQTLKDQERAAYAAGDTALAGLLTRLIELEDYVDTLERQVEQLEIETNKLKGNQ